VKKRSLGVLFIGALGSVATTVMAGNLAIRKGLVPIRGLITETEIAKDLSLVPLNDIIFGGWDIRSYDVFTAAMNNRTVAKETLEALHTELEGIKIFQGIKANMNSVTRQVYNISESDEKETVASAAVKLMRDIDQFKAENDVDSIVVVNVSSTEPPVPPTVLEWDLSTFEEKIRENDSHITPTMIYTYAALEKGCGFINFTPSICAELPALVELAENRAVPVAGKDGKTGQTLYKTVVGPMFKARDLKVKGWYSTNILGNTDGEILRDEQHGKTKLETKASGLQQILGYNDFEHLVRIDYYGPRGDQKEAWDNIDFEGWMGEKMSMKINWIGSDSVLAAPLLLDLARLVEYAGQRGEKGFLPHLGMFFKFPYSQSSDVNHDFFVQYSCFHQYVKLCLQEPIN
jgi:myo-inositol-1-phosphate synthase